MNTGLRLVIGSWKIMPMRLPRTARMARAGKVSRSCPSNTTRPAATRPGEGTRRMTDSDNMLLPQPLSPTMPSVLPRATERLTPSTAGTSPDGLRNTVRSPSICRREAGKRSGTQER